MADATQEVTDGEPDKDQNVLSKPPIDITHQYIKDLSFESPQPQRIFVLDGRRRGESGAYIRRNRRIRDGSGAKSAPPSRPACNDLTSYGAGSYQTDVFSLWVRSETDWRQGGACHSRCHRLILTSRVLV